MADADPAKVGGPNQAAAIVTYPGGPDKKMVNYNYKDTVKLEWYSWAKNDTPTTMQIWYLPSNAPKGTKWKAAEKKYTIPENGTLDIDLGKEFDKVENGFVLGEWNLNFTRLDDNPHKGLTLSTRFNCTFDDSKEAKTYSRDPNASKTAKPKDSTPSTSASASATSDSSAATITSSTSATSTAPTAGILNAATTTPTAEPVAASLSGGAIAGIVIAIIAAIALGAAGAFLLLRRKRQSPPPDAGFAAAAGGPPGYPPAYGSSIPQNQYAAQDMYKQQIAGYPAPPSMVPMGAAAGHYAPQSEKHHYLTQQQPYGVMPQAYLPQGVYASELAVPRAQDVAELQSPVERQQAVPAMELPAEAYR